MEWSTVGDVVTMVMCVGGWVGWFVWMSVDSVKEHNRRKHCVSCSVKFERVRSEGPRGFETVVPMVSETRKGT
jgi:hypothetical protein